MQGPRSLRVGQSDPALIRYGDRDLMLLNNSSQPRELILRGQRCLESFTQALVDKHGWRDQSDSSGD